MRTFSCQCGAVLFFHNTLCVACGATTALCSNCQEVCALESLEDATFRCRACHSLVRLCRNSPEFNVCNGTHAADSADTLCRYCSLTAVIPDLNVEGNLVLWQRLEAAKQRVLYQLDHVGLPINVDPADDKPKLRFEFKGDGVDRVTTGHDRGLITINVAEADSVVREQARVEFGEPQRTLIGHFRHELGHYYWDLLVQPLCIDKFREMFGDERTPAYADAQQAYYKNDTAINWQADYISRYATMHPWEDFAETFAAYLDMEAIVTTAQDFDRVKVNADGRDFDDMLIAYREIGVMANEFNRDMGLIDLVPDVVTPPVVEKLRFIHALRDRVSNKLAR